MWIKKQAAPRRNLPEHRLRLRALWLRLRSGLAFMASLALVAWADLATGWRLSMLPLYLGPVAIATWSYGRAAGIIAGCAIVPIGLAIDLASPFPLSASIWNAAMSAGVLFTFAVVIEQLKRARPGTSVPRSWGHLLAGSIGFAGLIGAFLLFQNGLSLGPPHRKLLSDEAAESSISSAAIQAANVAYEPGSIGELLACYADIQRLSRPLLLGSRDPHSASCMTAIKTGTIADKVPTFPYDIDGGVGTKLELVLGYSRNQCRRPSDELGSFQQRLRRYLENQLANNDRALTAVTTLASRSRELATSLEQADAIPASLTGVDLRDADDRLGHCLFELDRAVANNDLQSARTWGAEVASAAFSLSDLHLWLAFLFRNYLTALDFQQQCASLFAAADTQMANYNPSTMSYLPCGMLILHGDVNFLEVERRAEQLFGLPDDDRRALALDSLRTPGALWISPAQREAFLRLERALSTVNRDVLNRAARTPYETTYLNAMLDRAQRSDTIDQLIESARRFDVQNPQATVSQLMEVLMYRGHSFAGLEWGDRYHASLVDEASRLGNSDVAAFEQACARTNNFYKQSTYGRTFTLREALEKKCLDCVRATDMVAAMYRDAGHSNLGHVRWSCESFGHSVAAHLGQENGRPAVLLADPMEPSAQLERWPDAYFHGHRWPTGFENNPTPYCAELYVRGLDNYVWAEGYIIRGPHAGTLYSAAVPYLEGRTNQSVRKVFSGPYPQ